MAILLFRCPPAFSNCDPVRQACDNVINTYKHETSVLREAVSSCREERKQCIDLSARLAGREFLGIPAEGWILISGFAGLAVGVWLGANAIRR